MEDLRSKKALLARVDKAAGPNLVVSSNTSGLSVNALVADCSAPFRKRFLGTHFFNPPRYMKLVEVIPGGNTDPALLEGMKRFLREDLGKEVVEARDTPNFIANRLGIFALMEAMQRMEREGLGVEEVDAVTGPLLGRPASATLRLCDIIGLDTLLQVARTGYENLPQDSRREALKAPDFVHRMVGKGLLGAKSGAGFYRKTESGIGSAGPGDSLLPGVETGGPGRVAAGGEKCGPELSPAGGVGRLSEAGGLRALNSRSSAGLRPLTMRLAWLPTSLRWTVP